MSVNGPSAPSTRPVVAKPATTPAKSPKKPAATTVPTATATAGASLVTASRTASTPDAAPASAVTGAATQRTPLKLKTGGSSTSTSTRPTTTTTSPTPTDPPTPRRATGTKPKPLAPGSPAVPSDPPTRPVAGGPGNARTNPTPAGTTAAELDAAVPPDQRPAAITQQEQADAVAAEARRDARRFGENPTEMERGALDSYYEQHPTYVDPQTNVVYAASYDPATGDLTLTRNDEPATTVPEAPEEPAAPLSTRDDDYADDPRPEIGPGRRPGEKESGGAAGGTVAGGGPTPADDEHHPPTVEDSDGTRHVGVDDAPLGSGFPGPLGGGTSSAHVQDTVIVIAEDGSRVVTVNTALATEPPPGKPDEATSTVRTTDANGALQSVETSTEQTSVEDGGVVVLRTNATTTDGRTTTTWDDHRVDPSGDRTSRSTEQVTERGALVSDHRTTTASGGGVTLHDSAYTTFSGGNPDETVILRSAAVEGASRATRYTVDYDSEGFATTLTPPPAADADGREPLDAWVQEQLGPLGADETRPAFGVVRDGGVSDIDGTDVDGVVYVSEVGVRTSVDGVDVFVEGDSIAASSSLGTSVRALRDAWQGMPPSLQGAAATIDLLQGRSDGDRANSAKFESEFHAGASAGGDHMTYWLDNDPNVDTTRHEYGHLTGEGGGAPDEAAWDEAMAADEASGIREGLAGVDEDDIHFITSDQPLLSDELGVTEYAEKHLDENGNENDDWAESIAMYLSSREQGGVLQVRGDDGTVETYTFEELFPARAAILNSYYELGPAPEVAPPAFPEDAPTPPPGGRGSKGGLGGAVGGLGDIAGAIVDGATPTTATRDGISGGLKMLGNDTPAD